VNNGRPTNPSGDEQRNAGRVPVCLTTGDGYCGSWRGGRGRQVLNADCILFPGVTGDPRPNDFWRITDQATLDNDSYGVLFSGRGTGRYY